MRTHAKKIIFPEEEDKLGEDTERGKEKRQVQCLAK